MLIEAGRQPITVGMPGFLVHSIASLWLVAAGVVGSAATPSYELPSYFPGGLTNATGSIGCVRTLTGGVDVLDLASGRRLWKSDAPSRALLVGSDEVFLLEERGGRLQVAAYEPRGGRRIRTWPCSLGLPAWASPAEPGGGRTWTRFEVRARRNGDVLEIGYDARQFVATGIAPQSEGPRAKGIFCLDLGSGISEHLPDEALPPLPFVEPAPSRGWKPVRIHARAAGPELMLGGPPPDVEGALIAGDLRVVFERPANGRSVRVRRWRASTGAEDPPIEIAGVIDAIWPTLDREHVAMRRANEQSVCDLYSLTTGARCAPLARPIDIAVNAGRILWTTPSGRDRVDLIATNATTGRTLWRRTVWRDTPAGEPIP
jgi:hypothetical protein